MKKLKVFAALLVAAMCFSVLSCKKEAESNTAKPTTAQLAAKQFVFIEDWTDPVYRLPITSGNTTITYTSDNEEILSLEDPRMEENYYVGTIYRKAGHGFDEVKITATFKDTEGNTATKTGVVKVWQAEKEFEEDEAIDIAIKQFKAEMKAPSLDASETHLTPTVSFNNIRVACEYTSEDDALYENKHIVEPHPGYPIRIVRDIVDVTIKVKGRFSIYGKTDSQFKEAEVTLKLPAIREIKSYEKSSNGKNDYSRKTVFNGNTITNTEVKNLNDINPVKKFVYTSKYEYKIDDSKKAEMTLKLLKRSDVDGILGTDENKLYTPAEYKKAITAKFQEILECYKALTTPECTLDEVATVWGFICNQARDLNKGGIASYSKDDVIAFFCNNVKTEEEFNKLSNRDEVLEGIRLTIFGTYATKVFVSQLFVTPSQSITKCGEQEKVDEAQAEFDAYFADCDAALPDFIDRLVFFLFDTAPFKAKYVIAEEMDKERYLDGVTFYTKNATVADRPWYEQPGYYVTNFKREKISPSGVCFDGKVYTKGSWNSDYTIYTCGDKVFTVSETDNITQMNLSDGTETRTLTFDSKKPVKHFNLNDD